MKKYLKIFWITKGKFQLDLLQGNILVLEDNSNIIKNIIASCLGAISIGVLGIIGFPAIILAILIDKSIAFSKQWRNLKNAEEINPSTQNTWV